MRPPKEFRHILNNKANIKLGTLSKKESENKVIYVKTTFWITPHSDKDFHKDIKHFNYLYKTLMRNYIKSNDLFMNICILDFANKTNYMKLNKKSYVTIEAYLKQKQPKSIKDVNELFSKDFDGIVEKILNEMEKRNYSIQVKG